MNNMADLAQYYFVDDLPGSRIPASRLQNLLERLHAGRPLTSHSLSYFQTCGLAALWQLAREDVSYDGFLNLAVSEQNERKLDAAVRREEEEVLLRAKAERQSAYWATWEAERRARELDPKYIAKKKNSELRARYGLSEFIDAPHCPPRVMAILRILERSDRLPDDEVLWLKTDGASYFSKELRDAFHRREATFFAEEYKRTSDPWNAVNASSHYRKCELASTANELLNSIPAQRVTSKKLKSALATTHGGVMRDLGHFDKALQLGTSAHAMTPKDFRPCTLLGAVNFDLGNCAEGQEWFDKAVERGATERGIDSELRGILLRANEEAREKIRAYLIEKDPVRYHWVIKLNQAKPSSSVR